MSFEAQLQRSKQIEIGFARWLVGRGWYILPTYDFSGSQGDKAPKLRSARSSGDLIVPDLLGFKAGDRLWWEIKVKTRTDWTFATRREETGIDAHHWAHYVRVQAESRIPVWLVFAHEHDDSVRAARIDALAAGIRRAPKFGRRGGVFFDYAALKPLIALSALAARRAAA